MENRINNGKCIVSNFIEIMGGIWLPAKTGNDCFFAIGSTLCIETEPGEFCGILDCVKTIPDIRVGHEETSIEAVVLSTEYGDLEIPFCDILTIEVI